ncbi:hypothetical protein CF319_g7047 [Tilletia indica]|nr:hypothetical protein CF319_g7047 [Tilletia indica]
MYRRDHCLQCPQRVSRLGRRTRLLRQRWHSTLLFPANPQTIRVSDDSGNTYKLVLSQDQAYPNHLPAFPQPDPRTTAAPTSSTTEPEQQHTSSSKLFSRNHNRPPPVIGAPPPSTPLEQHLHPPQQSQNNSTHPPQSSSQFSRNHNRPPPVVGAPPPSPPLETDLPPHHAEPVNNGPQQITSLPPLRHSHRTLTTHQPSPICPSSPAQGEQPFLLFCQTVSTAAAAAAAAYPLNSPPQLRFISPSSSTPARTSILILLRPLLESKCTSLQHPALTPRARATVHQLPSRSYHFTPPHR